MSDLKILYDADCPFCSRYVTLIRLRETVGTVELIDARSGHPEIAAVKQLGFNLNQGMVARYKGVDYFGADCMHLLALLSSNVSWINRVNRSVFSNRFLAKLIYPFLRTGRNLTLRILGRSKIL